MFVLTSSLVNLSWLLFLSFSLLRIFFLISPLIYPYFYCACRGNDDHGMLRALKGQGNMYTFRSHIYMLYHTK